MPLPTRAALVIVTILMFVASAVPIMSVAHPEATRLYIGHSARLTAQIPAGWAYDPRGDLDYVGEDGFVNSEPAAGRTLEAACSKAATSPGLGRAGAVTETAWTGGPACRIEATVGGVETLMLVVPHPYPFELYGERYAFASITADATHFDAIAETLSFSPDRVTPEAYVTSVIDIVEARAWWSDGFVWEWTRQELLHSVEGLPTVESAHGAILDLVGKLRAVGDNHSFVLLPDQADALSESTGVGLLVGGRQVVMVYPDGPADRAGIRTGDLIVTVDGESVAPTDAPVEPSLPYAFYPEKPWDRSVDLTLTRPGEPEPITVTVEQGPYSRYVPPTGHRLEDEIGYIQIPHFVNVDDNREPEFASTADNLIAGIDAAPTCGWVVDLRLNGGGSYAPMVTGLGPILGNGTFVGWLDANGRQTWVMYEDGRVLDDGREVSNYLGNDTYRLQNPNPPVAVLTGPNTGSSGEVTTLAFVGRSDSRSFGETTGGYSTANVGYSLFDGTLLVLAEAAMTDRSGTTHLAGVVPDELIPNDWTAFGTDDDPVLGAAIDWLDAQPACSTPTPTPAGVP